MTSFIIFDLINSFMSAFRGRWFCHLYNCPISFIGTFVEVFEEVLEKVDRGRPFKVDVTIIFSSEIRNVQYDITIFRLTAAQLKIS